MSLSIVVKTSGDKKYEVEATPELTVKEFKDLIAEKSGIAVEQQRLIYSGRILKDHDTIGSYNIKSGNAVHLVKSAAKKSANSAKTASANSSSAAAVPQTLATGQVAGNPLSDLTGARYSGLANLPPSTMFGPDGGQGPMPSLAEMTSLMTENPEAIDAAINMLTDSRAPALQGMPPEEREMFTQLMRSPEMHEIMSDPQRLQQLMQASMQLQMAMEQAPRPNGGQDLGSMLQSLNSLNNSRPPSNSRFPVLHMDPTPPEILYETQLRQLNELGFYDYDRNVIALRRSGGNVEGAVEALLDGNV